MGKISINKSGGASEISASEIKARKDIEISENNNQVSKYF